MHNTGPKGLPEVTASPEHINSLTMSAHNGISSASPLTRTAWVTLGTRNNTSPSLHWNYNVTHTETSHILSPHRSLINNAHHTHHFSTVINRPGSPGVTHWPPMSPSLPQNIMGSLHHNISSRHNGVISTLLLYTECLHSPAMNTFHHQQCFRGITSHSEKGSNSSASMNRQ